MKSKKHNSISKKFNNSISKKRFLEILNINSKRNISQNLTKL